MTDILVPTVINASTLPDAWFQCLEAVIKQGHKYRVDKGSYEGGFRQELGCMLVRIKFPGGRPLVPDINPALGIPPPTTMEYVEEYLPYLMTPAKKPGEQYTYGEYLSGYSFYELAGTQWHIKFINQIEVVIKMLKKNHGTNHAIMTVGDPQSILLEDPPCLRLIQAKIIDGKLHFTVVFRSWDLWGGFPTNLAGIQLLKEYMGSEIGVEDGEIVAFSPGAHIYDFTWDIAELRTNTKIK